MYSCLITTNCARTAVLLLCDVRVALVWQLIIPLLSIRLERPLPIQTWKVQHIARTISLPINRASYWVFSCCFPYAYGIERRHTWKISTQEPFVPFPIFVVSNLMRAWSYLNLEVPKKIKSKYIYVYILGVYIERALYCISMCACFPAFPLRVKACTGTSWTSQGLKINAHTNTHQCRRLGHRIRTCVVWY